MNKSLTNEHKIFLSYCRADDEIGFVSALKTKIVEILDSRHGLGRVNIFFDAREIQLMQDWELEILSSLRESSMMIACVSDRYFGREWCEKEWFSFGDVELQLGVPEGVCTLLLQDEPPTVAGILAENQVEWRKGTSRVQFERNFWELTGGDPAMLGKAEVRDVIVRICDAIDSRLREVEKAAASEKGEWYHAAEEFVGRVEERTLIREHFFADPAQRALLIHGLSGIGKSALSFAYAHQTGCLYSGGRFRIQCEGATDLIELLVGSAHRLNIKLLPKYRRSKGVRFQELCGKLKQTGTKLIILDGLENPDILDPPTVDELSRANVHLLGTARRSLTDQSNERVHCLSLDKLGDHHAMRLFRFRRVPAEGDEELAAEELCRFLDGHSLAIEAASAYLKNKPNIRYRDLVDDLRMLGIEKFEGESSWNSSVNRERRLLITLTPTLMELEELEWDLISWSALLPPSSIPVDWLKRIAGNHCNENTKRDGAAVYSKFENSLSRLEKFRLLVVRGDKRLLEMHPLISEIVRSESIGKKRRKQRSWMAKLREMFRSIPVDGPDELVRTVVEAKTEEHCQLVVSKVIRWEMATLEGCARIWLEEERRNAVWIANKVCRPLSEIHGRYFQATELMRKAAELLDKRVVEGKGLIVDGLTISCWMQLIDLELSRKNAIGALERCARVTEAFNQTDFDEVAVLAPFYVSCGNALLALDQDQKAADMFLAVIEMEEAADKQTVWTIKAMLGQARVALKLAFILRLQVRSNGEQSSVDASELIATSRRFAVRALKQIMLNSIEQGVDSPVLRAEALFIGGLTSVLEGSYDPKAALLDQAEKTLLDANKEAVTLLPEILVAKALSCIKFDDLDSAAISLTSAATAEAQLSGENSIYHHELMKLRDSVVNQEFDSVESLELGLSAYLIMGAESLNSVFP